MGGYGSTRWGGHWKKDAVEDCNVLSVRDLIDYARLAPHVRVIGGGIAWYDTVKGEKIASIGVDIDTGPTEGYARLHYTVTPLYGQGDKFDVDYKVTLVTTRPYCGGLRWWFLCPGRRCGRRVAKLYFPPGNGVQYFLCRHCYDLTYKKLTDPQQALGLAEATGHADPGGPVGRRLCDGSVNSDSGQVSVGSGCGSPFPSTSIVSCWASWPKPARIGSHGVDKGPFFLYHSL